MRGLLDTPIATSYNKPCAEVAQSVEQRTENPKPSMPPCAVRYKLELLCQFLNPRFEAKVPFGDILSFLVCRLFVASFVAKMSTKQPPSKGGF
jgi:hypothetical protein